MNAEKIRELLRRQPFVPFDIHMTNGEIYSVRHPEQAMVAGATLVIYYPETDRIAWCSLLHVANVLMAQPA
jgi:hypothetical protein